MTTHCRDFLFHFCSFSLPVFLCFFLITVIIPRLGRCRNAELFRFVFLLRSAQKATFLCLFFLSHSSPASPRSHSDLVENVEVPLVLVLAHDSRFLQQEVGDFPSVRLSSSAELDLEVFPLSAETRPESAIRLRDLSRKKREGSETHKAAGVVVPDRFSVSKGLQKRVGLQDNVFYMLRRTKK